MHKVFIGPNLKTNQFKMFLADCLKDAKMAPDQYFGHALMPKTCSDKNLS